MGKLPGITVQQEAIIQLMPSWRFLNPVSSAIFVYEAWTRVAAKRILFILPDCLQHERISFLAFIFVLLRFNA